MKDYKAIFEGIETSLIAEGSKNLAAEKIRENLDWFKHIEGKKFSDNDYYQILVNESTAKRLVRDFLRIRVGRNH